MNESDIPAAARGRRRSPKHPALGGGGLSSALRVDSGVSSIQSHGSVSDMGANSSNVSSLFLLTCVERCRIANHALFNPAHNGHVGLHYRRYCGAQSITFRNWRLMLISFNYAPFHLFVIILQIPLHQSLSHNLGRFSPSSSFTYLIYALRIKSGHDASASPLTPAWDGVNDKNGKTAALIGFRLLTTRSDLRTTLHYAELKQFMCDPALMEPGLLPDTSHCEFKFINMFTCVYLVLAGSPTYRKRERGAAGGGGSHRLGLRHRLLAQAFCGGRLTAGPLPPTEL